MKRHRHPKRGACVAIAASALAACNPATERSTKPDLAKKPDRWVESITLNEDSQARFVGKTRDFMITKSSEARRVLPPSTFSIGDSIEGLRIGAIRCSYHWKDASHGGEQYMWRDRWDCMAGRDRFEIENAVRPSGEKRFDYIIVSPISLPTD